MDENWNGALGAVVGFLSAALAAVVVWFVGIVLPVLVAAYVVGAILRWLKWLFS
jgi:hypothetical protein